MAHVVIVIVSAARDCGHTRAPVSDGRFQLTTPPVRIRNLPCSPPRSEVYLANQTRLFASRKYVEIGLLHKCILGLQL